MHIIANKYKRRHENEEVSVYIAHIHSFMFEIAVVFFRREPGDRRYLTPNGLVQLVDDAIIIN